MKANFDSILKSTKNLLNMWKWRGLTLLGKIQIVKSLIIPKVLSKVALISVSEDLIKDINSLIYGFIWKGNDKIKRSTLINDNYRGWWTSDVRHSVNDLSAEDDGIKRIHG